MPRVVRVGYNSFNGDFLLGCSEGSEWDERFGGLGGLDKFLERLSGLPEEEKIGLKFGCDLPRDVIYRIKGVLSGRGVACIEKRLRLY